MSGRCQVDVRFTCYAEVQERGEIMEIYKEVIIQAVIIFPVVAALFTMPYMLYNYHKYGSVLSMRILIVYSFILYLLCAYFLVILPLPSMEEVAAMTGPRAQLVPFQFVQDIIKESHAHIADPVSWLTLINNRALFQVIFNIAMTVPFGVYLRYYFRCSLRKTAVLSFLLSLFFELTQVTGLYFIYPRGYRLFDVDDLIANTLGGLAGYFVAAPFLKFLPTRAELDQASFRRGAPFLKFLPTRAELDQASFRRGKEVSLLRRLLAFMLDIPFAVLFAVLLARLVPVLRTAGGFPAFVLYFILAPVILKGGSIGKKLMKLRVASYDQILPQWYRYMIRYGSLWAVLYLVPVVIAGIGNMLPGGSAGKLVYYGLFCGGWCFFLFFEFIRLAMHRPLFYEKLSKTIVISTIEDKERMKQEKMNLDSGKNPYAAK